MVDNSQDKGYTMVRVKQVGNEWHLCEIGFDTNPEESNFYADYENGTIYIDLGDGNKSTIGYYSPSASGTHTVDVYDRNRSRIIGSVGGELIQFRAREADYSAGRYLPDTEYLAYYNDRSGSITKKDNLLAYVGIINGNIIGGAAAFVALFYSYSFKSIYRDYFELDANSFKEKYPSF